MTATMSDSSVSSVTLLSDAVHGPQNVVDPKESDNESRKAMLVRDLFLRAREARRPLMQQWKRNYITLNNRQYRPGAEAWEEQPAIASIWPGIASATSWMTDQRPIIKVTPTTEQFSEYWGFYQKLATQMNTVLTAIFQNYMCDAEISKVLWDVHTYGVGYFKTVWSPWLADGLGDANFVRCDPFTIYPDPYAKSSDDLGYIVEAKTMTIADADRSWPGAARKLQPQWFEDADEQPHRLDGQINRGQPRTNLQALAPSPAPNTSPQPMMVTGKPGAHADAPVVTVLECYIRGYKTAPDPDNKDVMRVQDDWRCLVVCGNCVLMDSPCSEMSAYNTHPYDRMVLFDTGEWYGPCLVELLTPIQRIINWLLGAMNRNIYLMGNPVLAEDRKSASRNKRWSNKPGQRIEASPQSVGWLSPPQPHPLMSTQLVQYYEGKIETILGLSAMQRGFAPTGRNAEGVINSVQDAAFVRVRATLRELERALRGVASKMAAEVAEFYTEPRLMAIIGPDGRETHLSLRARHFYAIDAENPQSRIPLRFSLVADAGSQLPTSKEARGTQALTLFQMGAIDIYELLKALEWPDYANTSQRIMQQNAAAMATNANSKKR